MQECVSPRSEKAFRSEKDLLFHYEIGSVKFSGWSVRDNPCPPLPRCDLPSSYLFLSLSFPPWLKGDLYPPIFVSGEGILAASLPSVSNRPVKSALVENQSGLTTYKVIQLSSFSPFSFSPPPYKSLHEVSFLLNILPLLFPITLFSSSPFIVPFVLPSRKSLSCRHCSCAFNSFVIGSC